jgi:LL-diaminopimelate aminotransferase
MRIAERVASLPPYLFAELERKIAEKRQAGVDVISLGIGDPDLPSPTVLVEEAQRQVARPDTHQYPSNRGRAAFREAIATFYSGRFGVELDPETEVLPLLGGKEGIAHVCWSMLDPGDVCLAADPGYPVYTSGPLLAGAEPVLMPLTPENDFQPDLEVIPADVRRRANLLFCNYPNNPTGAVIEDDFFERLARFGLENAIPIVHDNAYSEITFDGYVAQSFLAAPGAKEAGVEMFSLSKSYGMAGWRLGFVVGNAEIVERINLLNDHARAGIFMPLQRAALAALTGPQESVAERAATYERRRDRVVEAVGGAAEGTFFVWLRLPAGVTAERLLTEHRVAVAPGEGFGARGAGWARLSLAVTDETLATGVERLRRAFAG